MTDRSYLKQLIENPSESLSVELKNWIDVSTPEGAAKLVKFALAARNHNGGFLLIGFDDETLMPISEQRPENVQAAYHVDLMQAQVLRYASESFEVQVHFLERDGLQFPIVEVPSGVRTPVSARRSLVQDGTKVLIRENAVYVRSLAANNTPSTTEAKWGDWSSVVEACFDNREADIGRFVRRHLNASNISDFAALLGYVNAGRTEDASERSRNLLESGMQAFKKAVTRSKKTLPGAGYFEIAAVIEGELIDSIAPNQALLNLIASASRHLNGWPMFVVLHNPREDGWKPRLVSDAWEAAIIRLDGSELLGHRGVDYWRVEPVGTLYALRGYDEDFNPVPGMEKSLKILPPIWDVTDGFAETLSIAKQIVKNPAKASLAVTIRWTGLQGRNLSNVSGRRYWGFTGGEAIDDDAIFSSILPVDLPDSAFAEYVGPAVATLFRKFQGFEVGQSTIEQEVEQVLSRRS